MTSHKLSQNSIKEYVPPEAAASTALLGRFLDVNLIARRRAFAKQSREVNHRSLSRFRVYRAH